MLSQINPLGKLAGKAGGLVLVLLVAVTIGIASCVDRFPLDVLPDPQSTVTIGDTTYLEVTPPFAGFNGPSAVMVGKDQLLYVADTRSNRVVMMNLGGEILGTRTILQPIALEQDLRLDLLVGGAIVEATGDTIGAVFRIKLVQSNHRIETARLDTVWKEPARPRRRFVGIGTFPDNMYLVVRRGPDNLSFVDPDGRVLLFDANDKFLTPLGDLVTRAGSGITDINLPTGIAMFPNSRNFVLLQSSEGVAYGALWMVYQQSVDFEGWLARYDPARLDHRSVDFIRPNRFVQPTGAVVDGRRGDIFIVDVAQDSVFKFDSRGALRSESFGEWRTNGRMKRPTSVAFFDRTLFIADETENVIFKFRLSTDF